MSDMSVQAYRNLSETSFWRRHGLAIQRAGAYAALGFIAAVLIGSLSVHPF